tara:strand:+ start:984 stop:1382 length:399 start_codon:yes stop_codon:yes gene_type:complete
MKYLSNYTEKPISELIKNNGGFFAFNDKQFKDNKKDGVKYARLYSGLIAPKENIEAIIKGIDDINKKGIIQDMEDHSIKQIIFRECSNYELQYSDDGLKELSDTLIDYPIKQIDIKIYFNQFIHYCIKNELI